jgi:hypothetical protein
VRFAKLMWLADPLVPRSACLHTHDSKSRPLDNKLGIQRRTSNFNHLP